MSIYHTPISVRNDHLEDITLQCIFELPLVTSQIVSSNIRNGLPVTTPSGSVSWLPMQRLAG